MALDFDLDREHDLENSAGLDDESDHRVIFQVDDGEAGHSDDTPNTSSSKATNGFRPELEEERDAEDMWASLG